MTTDADGRFRTPPLPVGRLSLIVRAQGRRLAYCPSWPIAPGSEEDLGKIHLERDVPIPGIVVDPQGRPIVGARVLACGEVATTDAGGTFTLQGFGPGQQFQFQVRKEGFVFTDWVVDINGDGARWHKVAGNGESPGRSRDLTVVMKPEAHFEGMAVDAGTGEPVRLDRVVLCDFERKPGGEIVRGTCRISRFDQPEPGRFRVPYAAPAEYHLTFSAAGYHDAEVFTPKVTTLKTIGAITVRLRRQVAGTRSEVPRQRIVGRATRDGRPVKSGWVGLWAPPRARNAVNAPILRGRTVVGGAYVAASAPIRDGAYAIDVPFQDPAWYVVVEEAGEPLTQVGPVPVALGEEKPLDIACVAGGRIRGRLKGVQPGWDGALWVVAFTRTGIRAETQVGLDGRFTFPPLPLGEYGLKVGHDGYRDSEVPWRPPGEDFSQEEWARQADPWTRAVVVRVETGRETAGVEIEPPQ